MTHTQTLLREVRKAYAPPPELRVSEFADQSIVVTSGPLAGTRWQTAFAPYQRGILDVFHEPGIEIAAVMGSSQWGKTACAVNVVAYHMAHDPCPILVVEPTVQPMAQDFSRNRLEPVIAASPILKETVSKKRAKDASNTTLQKALALDTPIPTPTGWLAMGELAVGDAVLDEQGQPCRVTSVTAVMQGRACYRLRFSDGSEITADEDHRWAVEHWEVKRIAGVPKQTNCRSILTTAQLTKRPTSRRRFAIRATQPLALPHAELPIDPYVLGAWLGDGLSHRAAIVAGVGDEEIADLIEACGVEVQRARVNGGGLWCFSLDKERWGTRCSRGHVRTGPRARGERCRTCVQQRREGNRDDKIHRVGPALSSLGLLKAPGRRGGDSRKRIPPMYLRASAAQRLALLQGLMDTDGHIRPKDGWCVYVTVLPGLADDMWELLVSLGLIPHRSVWQPKLGREAHTIGFAAAPSVRVFRLKRKRRVQESRKAVTERVARRRILEICPVNSVPVKCITVDSPNSLYLAGRSMIPTHNTFRGGSVAIGGANSAASLAARSTRLLVLDEVDRYPPELPGEGSTLAIAFKRTTAYRRRRRILLLSSPTLRGAPIHAWFQRGDQRRYYVPCPACSTMHPYEWSNVRWQNEDPQTARVHCPACDYAIGDAERVAILSRGEWRPENEHGEKSVASFHLWECYSPLSSLPEIVTGFLRARASQKAGDRAEMHTWQNTTLGEPIEPDGGEGVEPHVLLMRREMYPADLDVPAGACCLTMGVDVQDDRLELLVIGWGPGEESWLVDRQTLPGDTEQPGPWKLLDEVLAHEYMHASGQRIPVQATCIDSAGHRTTIVYDYAARQAARRVYPIIGRDGQRPIVSSPSPRKWGRQQRQVPLYTIGVDAAKALLLSRLSLPEKGPGFVHMPHTDWCDDELAAQLTSERLVMRWSKGVPSQVWKKIRPRNEALDCAVYALAALRLLHPSLELLAQRLTNTQPAKAAAAPPVKAPWIAPRPGGWLRGGR